MHRGKERSSNTRIVHVTTVDLSLRNLLLNQLLALKDAGYEVSAVSAPGPYVDTIRNAGIRYIPLRMTRKAFDPLTDLSSLISLYRLFRRERFTIVHTHTPKAGIYGRVAARLARTPIVVHTSHGTIFDESSPRWWRYLFSTLERVAALCANRIFSVNREDLETAVRLRIAPRRKLTTLGPGGIGIDMSLFEPSHIDPARLSEIRRSLGIADGAPVVGFVGRLAKSKGFLDFLEAAKRVSGTHPDVRFLVVGGPDVTKPADSVREDAAHAYGVWDSCVFVGMKPQEELPALYALMTLLVLPSEREGIPRAIMEAAAMEVPAVATDVKGNRETVIPGRTGLLIPYADASALASAIQCLIDDPARTRQMGRQARANALERFDERLVFRTVEAEYERLLAERGMASPRPATASARTNRELVR